MDSNSGAWLHGAIPDTLIDYFEGFTSRGNKVVWVATVIRLISTPASNRTKRRLNSGDQAPDAFYQFHINRQSLKSENRGARDSRRKSVTESRQAKTPAPPRPRRRGSPRRANRPRAPQCA